MKRQDASAFTEKASGGRWDRPELHRMLEDARKGDQLCIWKLDRLSRSLTDLLKLMERLSAAQVGFKSLTILGALSTQGMLAAMTVQAATDREVFLTFLQQVICPNCGPATR